MDFLRLSVNLIRRYFQYKAGKKLPIFCSYYITKKCNLTCKGCIYFDSYLDEGRAELDTEDCLKIIYKLKKINLPVLVIMGGEPLLRNDIFLIGNEAKKVGLFTVLFTNGVLINSENANWIDKEFHRVLVSIDGLEEGDDLTRGEGNFKKSIEGIRTLIRNRKHTKIIATCVINKYNIKELKDYVFFMKEVGVDKVKFQPNFIKSEWPIGDDIEEGIFGLLEAKKKFKSFIIGNIDYYKNLIYYFKGTLKNRCFARNIQHIAITHDGFLSVCSCIPSFTLEHSAVDNELSKLLKVDEQCINSLVKDCIGCYRFDDNFVTPIFEKPFYKVGFKDFMKLFAF